MAMRPQSMAHSVQSHGLADVLERVLDEGMVIAGDIKIKLVDIELLTIQIRLLIASVDKAREMGLDWWMFDPSLNSRAKADDPATVSALQQRIENLEAALAGQRPDVVNGTGEAVSFPWTAAAKQTNYRAATASYAEAFAADVALVGDVKAGHRYNAACCAALAANGQGKDAGACNFEERQRLRKQALAWLRAELSSWAGLVENGPIRSRTDARLKLPHWRKDPDLASLREPAELAKLPEAERGAFAEFWADLDALLRRLSRDR